MDFEDKLKSRWRRQNSSDLEFDDVLLCFGEDRVERRVFGESGRNNISLGRNDILSQREWEERLQDAARDDGEDVNGDEDAGTEDGDDDGDGKEINTAVGVAIDGNGDEIRQNKDLVGNSAVHDDESSVSSIWEEDEETEEDDDVQEKEVDASLSDLIYEEDSDLAADDPLSYFDEDEDEDSDLSK